MSKHTPGPWKIVDDHPDPNLQCLHVFHDDEQIADVLELKNAHLIAAAPELLKALDSAVVFLIGAGVSVEHAAMKRYCKVLAKAKGE